MRKEIVVKEETVKPLSVLEQKRLEQLEEVVVENLKSVFLVGLAWAEIQERKLFRKRSKTFDLYIKEFFGVARGTAYRYIAAGKVMENISNWRQNAGDSSEIIDMIPMNEAQVRPLTRLRPEQQVTVWKAAVECAPRGKVTAGHVNKVVKKYLGEVTTTGIRNTQASLQQEPVSANFKAAFDAFLDQINKEKEAGYKTTPKAMIIKYVVSLRAILAEGEADGLTEGSELIEERAFNGGSNDANKLLRAGYRLFRTDRSSMTIKESNGGGWKKHSGPFDTVKAMEAEFKAVLQDEKHLQG